MHVAAVLLFCFLVVLQYQIRKAQKTEKYGKNPQETNIGKGRRIIDK